MIRFSTLIAVVCLSVAPAGLAADSPFFLKDGETVVFFGDSITQAGLYVDYIEAYLVTAFPDKQFHIVNRGISGETIAGTCEPGHNPPRGNVHDRFTRDLVGLKPDVIVSCFGMNDGNYFPFDPERFAKYQDGNQRLVKRVREETRARLVIVTPPCYDAYRRQVADPNAAVYGYKFPAIDYDNVLGRYAEWLLTLRGDGISVIDLHTAMNRHLQQRREKKVSFSLQPDGVHPEATGHWLMAQTLLEAWNAPPVRCEAKIDATNLKVVGGDVKNLRRDDKAIAFTWRMPVPMPMDPGWDKESIALAKVRERFNPCTLSITGLPPGRYRLTGDEPKPVELDQAQLERGLDLLGCPAFSADRISGVVLAMVHKHQQTLRSAWRKAAASAPAAGADAERAARAMEQALRRECQPRDVTVTLEPIP